MAHAHRLRIGRYSETGRIYLVTSVCWQRRPVFADFYAARQVVNALMEVVPSAETLCYVVMPDHVHWLMQLCPGSELSATVRFFKVITTRRIRRMLTPDAKVWQPGFHDHAVRREEDLRTLAQYVVANPLRAGLVRSVKDYSHWDAVWL